MSIVSNLCITNSSGNKMQEINNIKVISVENNIPKEQNFKNFFDTVNFTYLDRIGQDEIFYNNEYYKF